MQRKPPRDPDTFRSYSREVFLRNVAAYRARHVIPSAFGWKVDGIDRDDRYDWANRTLFPFTPDQAVAAMQEAGQDGFKWLPGNCIAFRNGTVIDAPGQPAQNIYRALEMTEGTDVPAFVPGAQHERAAARDTDALIARVNDEVIGTRYWQRATELGRKAQVRLSDGAGSDAVYHLDPGAAAPWQRIAGADLDDTRPYTWLHADTLARLLDSDLLMSSSYGLWVSTDNWLTHAFHHPKYYVRHQSRITGQSGQAAA